MSWFVHIPIRYYEFAMLYHNIFLYLKNQGFLFLMLSSKCNYNVGSFHELEEV